MYHLLPVQSGKEKKKKNNNIQSPLFDFSADIGQDPEQIILEGCLDAHDRKRSLKIITLMVKRPNACATLTTYNQQKRERKRDYSPKDPQQKTAMTTFCPREQEGRGTVGSSSAAPYGHVVYRPRKNILGNMLDIPHLAGGPVICSPRSRYSSVYGTGLWRYGTVPAVLALDPDPRSDERQTQMIQAKRHSTMGNILVMSLHSWAEYCKF
ncbi:hypothetical protein V8E54_001249 [Elaphomyces granulatus]